MNARYYDSKIARFLSEDTYTGDEYDPLSLNLYTYCSNNPIIYTDPTGHWQEKDSTLSSSAQAQILEATKEYNYAKTHKLSTAAAEKKANDARKGKIYKTDTKVSASSIANDLKTVLSSKYVSDKAKSDVKKSKVAVAGTTVAGRTIVNEINTARKSTNNVNSQGTGKTTSTQGVGTSYIESSLNQLVYGNYTDDVTLLGTGAQILTGIIGIDLPADIRDITADLSNGDVGKLAIDTLAFLPVVGSFKYVDEVDTLLKNGNEVTTVIKGGNNAGYKANDTTPKGRTFTEHAAERANERGFSTKNIDDIVDNCKKPKTKVDWEGKKTYEYVDNRGNKVVLNEKGGIVSVHSPASGGKYIPSPSKK